MEPSRAGMILRKASYSSRDVTPTRQVRPLPPAPSPKAASLAAAEPVFAVDHHAGLLSVFERLVDGQEPQLADVVFEVGGQELGALRRVLALRSAVLEELLRGEDNARVALPEFEAVPGAFRQFLLYAHAGQCQLESVGEVLGLYEIAEAFGVAELREACAEHLDRAEISDELVVELSSFAVRHDVAGLLERVVNHVADHADLALADPVRAAALPPLLLKFIFRSTDIAVAEATLIKVLQELPKELQGSLAPHVRLPRLAALDMMRLAVPSGLFEEGACLAALAYRENPASVELPEEQRLPRAQSALAKLPPRRGSKGPKDVGGPWGRDFLRFARQEARQPEGPQPEEDEEAAAVAAEAPRTPCASEEDWGPPESEPSWRAVSGQ